MVSTIFTAIIWIIYAVSIHDLLEIFTLEEIFEQCNVTPEEVLEFLVKESFIELPPYMENEDGTFEES